MSNSKEAADGENPLTFIVKSLQLRNQELEAENAELLLRLSNCTCSKKEKKLGSSAVNAGGSLENNLESESVGSKIKKMKLNEKTSEKKLQFPRNLSKELLVEIMSSLLPESLIRFKRVLKSWNISFSKVSPKT